MKDSSRACAPEDKKGISCWGDDSRKIKGAGL